MLLIPLHKSDWDRLLSDYAGTRATRTKHGSQIFNDEFWLLMGEKVATAFVLAFVYDRAKSPAPGLWQDGELFGSKTKTKLDSRYELLGSITRDSCGLCMSRFVVDTEACSRSRGREPVDTDPVEYLVVRPGIIVSPIVQFLVDPSKQSDRAVSNGIPWSLRLCALNDSIARAFVCEPVTSF